MKDCIIIGGGLIGMLSARALRRRGLSVGIIERGPFGRAASWAGGGILSPLYPWREAPAVIRLAALGAGMYPALARELAGSTGIDPEWRPCGILNLEANDAEPALAWARQHGFEMNVIAAAAIPALEPRLSAQNLSALYRPNVAQIRNPRLLKALQQDLRNRGVDLLAEEEVVAIETRNGRVAGIRTAGDTIYRCENVVIANGAWSSRLLQGTGVNLDIRPIRGQMILLQGAPGMLRHIVLQQGHYLIPRADGAIVAGSTVEDVGFNPSTTEQGLLEIKQFIAALAPGLAELPVAKHWAGLRPGCGQGIPYIGAHPRIEGLYVNAGHFRNGIVMAPASAELLAALMLGKTPPLHSSPYSLQRNTPE
ncbi:MAG TPA: glycine oxidase ThiO [Gammaproteobacteria bacterium]|nr:glycine oxidase ThiO [Gammaproteobacteria bacterium]